MATATISDNRLLSQYSTDSTVTTNLSITGIVALDNARVNVLSSIIFSTTGALAVVDTPRTTVTVGKACTLVLQSAGYLENSSQGTSAWGSGLTVPKGVIG